MKWFNAIGNSIVKRILSWPLHGIISTSFMLITVTGRKSGKLYTTPVNYARERDVITVVSRKNRIWWRNLRGGAPVTVRVRGKDLKGVGEVVEGDSQAIAKALRAIRPRLSAERAEQRAQDRVIIRIKLS